MLSFITAVVLYSQSEDHLLAVYCQRASFGLAKSDSTAACQI